MIVLMVFDRSHLFFASPFCNLLGIELNTFSLSKIEANTQHIKASQFKAIPKALNCDPMDLLQESDSMMF